MKKIIPFMKKHPLVPVIRLQGTIGSGGRALSDRALAPIIERAFCKGKPTAVALLINSPGGAPVQSSLIAARIRRLADEKKIPVHAFVEDVAASGGYWLASAADYIWADASSILGSIGVISASFGFPEFIERHGIERRVHTAGRAKSFADPFKPQSEADIARIHAMLAPLHETFITQIKTRRGARLKEGADLFNADIWIGQTAVDLGIADGIAHVQPKLKELYGDKVRMPVLGGKRSLAQRFGAELKDTMFGAVEERALWARFGL